MPKIKGKKHKKWITNGYKSYKKIEKKGCHRCVKKTHYFYYIINCTHEKIFFKLIFYKEKFEENL